MKNITLAIDEDVLREARKIAAERETTVNALVRDYLARLTRQRAEGAKARAELARLSDASDWRLPEDWRWSREELYDRPVLPGHQRPDLRRDGQGKRRGKKKTGA